MAININGLRVRIKRMIDAHNPDGTAELHVFLEAETPPPPRGSGEPLPVEDVA